jgi:hypothetical protein
MFRLFSFSLSQADCRQLLHSYAAPLQVAVSLTSLYQKRAAIVSCSRTYCGELHRFLLEMRLLLWQNLDHASPWLNSEATS